MSFNFHYFADEEKIETAGKTYLTEQHRIKLMEQEPQTHPDKVEPQLELDEQHHQQYFRGLRKSLGWLLAVVWLTLASRWPLTI